MSKTLASLTTDLNTVVKRPDLANDYTLHLQNAILKAHQSDYYLKDLFESAFVFSVPATSQSLDPTTLLPRWRKSKYFNIIDPITGDIVRQMTPIVLENFVNQNGFKRDYVWYEAGSLIQFRMSGQEVNIGFGGYLYPDVTLAVPSWIADSVPYAIVYEAARTLFKAIGFDEQSMSMEKLVAEAMAMVRMIGLPTVGD